MNSLRITAGKYRGRKIATPGGATHPMGERERLALFNMIANYVPGAKILDAFAGSGALGIEALSRGALEAIFIEKSAEACRVIRENLQNLDYAAEVWRGDVKNFTTENKFGLILADPPYDNFEISEVTHLLQFLQGSGVFVLSHPGGAPELAGMTLLKSRKYARAGISVYFKG